MWLAIAAMLLVQAADDDLERGRKALEENHVAEAVPFLEKAAAIAPDDYAAHFQLGLAYSLLKRDDAALAEYQKTLQLKPGLYQAEMNEAILLAHKENYPAAVPLLRDAQQQKPKEFRPVFYLGEVLLKSGEAVVAVQAYRAALAIDPQSAPAELGLGRALLKSGKLEEGAPHIEHAAAAKPEYRQALLELANAYETANQQQAAIDIYMKFPQDAAVQEHMGALLIEQQRFADALPRLEQAVASSPTTSARLKLAQDYLAGKEPAKAAKQLNEALQADPNNFEVRLVLARVLRDQHQLPAAANQFYAATKLKPDSVEAWNELAAVLMVHEDYVPGLAALDHVKALGAEKPGNHFLRAIALDKLKQRQPALDSYRQFLATANGKYPDEEFQARQRARILEREINKR